jgi:hypothetical protein
MGHRTHMGQVTEGRPMGGSMPAGSSGSELCEVCVCVVCVCVCVCVCTHVHTYITCVYAHICTHI